MESEVSKAFREEEAFEEEPRDRTKWIWIGVGGVLVIMVVVLAMRGQTHPPYSRVHARHILIKCDMGDPVKRGRAMERLVELKERLEQGESFARIAEKHSDDEWSASRGGSLGWSKKGMYQDEFEDYVWSAPIGEVSGPIPTSHGLHLIRVDDRYLSEVDRHLNKETAPDS